MKERFIQFLKDNKIYNRFCGYYAANRIKPLDYYLDNTNPKYFILNSFSWSKTDEGEEFWTDLDYKWVQSIADKEVSIKLSSNNKSNLEISLDIATALERMGYVASLIEVK